MNAEQNNEAFTEAYQQLITGKIGTEQFWNLAQKAALAASPAPTEVTDADINELLGDLDTLATQYDVYDYGLPDHDPVTAEKMRNRVRALLSRAAPQPEAAQPAPMPARSDYATNDDYGDAMNFWRNQRIAQLEAAAPQSQTTPTAQSECRYCKGSGVDGDCGPDGAPIDVPCSGCNGSGRASLSANTPAEQTPQPLPEHAGTIFDDGYWLRNEKGPIPATGPVRQNFYTSKQMREYALLSRTAQPAQGVEAILTLVRRYAWDFAQHTQSNTEATKAAADASYSALRLALNAAQPAQEPDGILTGLKEAVEAVKEDGFWRSCSGCYETEDGHPVGKYPFSDALGCALGGGCHECGGLGAVWDDADYSLLSNAMTEDADHPPQQVSRDDVKDAANEMYKALQEIGHIMQAFFEGGYGKEGDRKKYHEINKLAQTWLKYSKTIDAAMSTPNGADK